MCTGPRLRPVLKHLGRGLLTYKPKEHCVSTAPGLQPTFLIEVKPSPRHFVPNFSLQLPHHHQMPGGV
ncbi:uncharacterized protein CLUP02_17105 [Colletotrichum lupini]|uniref:Uncharacterized protein n=1 Tax=Colletotrichum lupini TaxID=145971 RepID=A0A9Q8WQ60_9PEZI|nr:uncharacterized protein CLUP02_17105 [Colletotrichum lupini]UQC91569.1 hypothetical protein CLUP02_17105 [Colletotrichum lupini]